MIIKNIEYHMLNNTIFNSSSETNTIDTNEIVYVKLQPNKYNKTLTVQINIKDIKQKQLVAKWKRIEKELDMM
jgi:hypothetical protein